MLELRVHVAREHPDVSAFLGKNTPDGKAVSTDTDLSMYLLEHAHVATVPGSAFCLPGYIRLSYAAGDDALREAFARIGRALAELY